MASPLDIFKASMDGADRGRERGLAQLLGKAYAAPKEQRSSILGQVAQLGAPQAAFNAETHFQSMDDNARKRFADYALAFQALPDEQKPMAYPQFAQQAQTLGIPAPTEWRPEFAPNIAKLAQALGGTAQQEMRPHVVGNALVDASGKVLYQGEAAQKWQLVNVPDGQGGSRQMEYSNGQWRQPNYSGGMPAPATGGGGQILDDAAGAALDPVSDFSALAAFPGVQVSSLARDPGRNAKVDGVPNSFHLTGEAGDFTVPPEQRQPFIAHARSLGYQAIDEGDHVHVEPPQRGITSSQFAPGQGVAQAGRMGYTPPKARGQTQMLSPQEVSQLGLPAGTVAQRKPDGSVSVVNRPTKVSDKPQMPVRAVMADLEIEDALGASESVFRLAEKHLSRMANGELVVGTPEAAGATVRTFLNMPNDNDVALTELKADRTSIVNASLRLNKGVQTEGDAQRAVKELMAADDHKTTLAALKRLIDINKRAVQLQTRKRNLLRQNYQGGEATQQTQADDDIESLIEMYR